MYISQIIKIKKADKASKNQTKRLLNGFKKHYNYSNLLQRFE